MTDLGDKAKERFLRETQPPEVEGVKIDWSPLPHPAIRDLRGMRFGKLLVKAYSHTREQANGIPCVYWTCQCDCGNDRPVARDQLLRKGTSSCGCLSFIGNQGVLNASKTHQKRAHMTKRMRHGLPPVAPTEVIGDPANVFAYDSLMAYACLQWAGYEPAAHHHLIAKYLEKVEKGKIKRLMIFLPPRAGKSMVVSEYFPAWYLGRNPDKRIIATSYGQELASDFGRKVRNQIADPMYGEIFPDVGLSGDSAASDKFDMAPPHKGGYFAVGAGGAITGRGANCFSGETLISTEVGLIDIATLVQLEYRPRVLSFNHEKNLLEFKCILAVQESVANDLIEIRTSGKRSVRVTRDHAIYDHERGYRAAEVFEPGDRLISCEIKVEQDLFPLWGTKEWARLYMQGLLQQATQSRCCVEMRKVWNRIYQTAVRVRETVKKASCGFLLFSKMFSRASCGKKPSLLQRLWESSRKESQEILHKLSSKTSRQESRRSSPRENMPDLQYCFYGEMERRERRNTCGILQQTLLGIRAFLSYGWGEQSSLDSWIKLCAWPTILHENLSGNTSSGVEEGQLCLRCLWGEREKNARPSFRWETNKQSSFKLGNALHILPSEDSFSNGLWTGYDEVESVIRVCETTIVYDIQVESNHNLFANGILCHNCLIIDDPIKSREESDSETSRRKIKDWYTSVAYTRLMDNGAIIICQTRWNVDDLSGWLLREHKHEKWTVLNLPAINEKGEALWPERFPLPVLENIRKTLPARDWQALYQQKPFIEEGNIYKRQWWNLWPDTKPLPECEFIIQSWDTAYSDADRKKSSYSARVTLGVFKRVDDEFHNIILIEYWKGRVEYPELRKESLRAYQDYEPDKVIIEKKASGNSLIQDLRRGGLPLATYTPEKDKITRAYAAQSLLENGRLYYPARKWAEEFISALARFPNPDDDDVADAFSQAIIWLQSSFLVAHADDAKRRQHEDAEDEDLPSNVTRFKPKKKRAAYG